MADKRIWGGHTDGGSDEGHEYNNAIAHSPLADVPGKTPTPHGGTGVKQNRHKELIVGDPASDCPVGFTFYHEVPSRGDSAIENSPLIDPFAPGTKSGHVKGR